MSDRNRFLADLIGKPWQADGKGPDAFDCWHLARHIEAVVFSRELPEIDVPAEPTWAWMIETIRDHAERSNWHEVPCDGMGLVRAGDGAVVLMARRDRPAHIGVWLRPEASIIHADAHTGVTFEPLQLLRAKGWRKLRFFEPLR